MNQTKQAIRTLFDEERHLSESGRMFAPCGATVQGPLVGHPIQPSTADILRVTCTKCRDHIRTLGRAYQMARRRKQIDW